MRFNHKYLFFIVTSIIIAGLISCDSNPEIATIKDPFAVIILDSYMCSSTDGSNPG